MKKQKSLCWIIPVVCGASFHSLSLQRCWWWSIVSSLFRRLPLLLAFVFQPPFKQHLWNSFFYPSLPLSPPFLSPPHIRSQPLWDGPVSSRFWTQRRRPQPPEPLGPRPQWSCKQQQQQNQSIVPAFITDLPSEKTFSTITSSDRLVFPAIHLWHRVAQALRGLPVVRQPRGWMLISLQSSLQRAWRASKQL